MFRASLAMGVVFLALCPAFSADFKLMTWNTESNRGDSHDSDPDVIADQLTDRVDELGPGIVGLVEVRPENFRDYRDAVEDGINHHTDFVTSASGGFQDEDSMIIIIDDNRFDFIESYELHRYKQFIGNSNNPENGELTSRSPLVARIRDTNFGVEFLLVLNHLARSNNNLRREQAKMLREWARDQTLPVIAAGDFNFDYDFETEQADDAFDAFLEGDIYKWLKPEPLVDTQWTAGPNDTDQFPHTILDFVFVAKGAKDWPAESDVVVRNGDFPDDETTSDHRPLITKFTVGN